MGMDNWGEKRFFRTKVLSRALVRTMKKTCWSCLGGRDNQETKPRETNCDSNSASAQSKESTSKSKTETAASKQQIQKPNAQQNNSKAQAKTLTHCYAYSSFLWGLEMTWKKGKVVAESLLISRRKLPLLKCQANKFVWKYTQMCYVLWQESKSGLQLCI